MVMLKKYLFASLATVLLSLISFPLIYAQGIGINETGAAPDPSAILDASSIDKGFLFPRMTTVERNNISSPALGLQVFDTNTNSIWFFNGSQWESLSKSSIYGDIKSGVQVQDHQGWVKLDGRNISSLSLSQQSVATSLGFTNTLPNATNAYLVQNGASIASVSGSNTRVLTQANLPNISFTGSTNTTGSHNHSGSTNAAGGHAHNFALGGSNQPYLTMITSGYSDYLYGGGANQPAVGTLYYGITSSATSSYPNMTTGTFANALSSRNNPAIAWAGSHSHSLSINSSGNHSHSVSVSSGGSATPVITSPRSLSVNMFIYLGE